MGMEAAGKQMRKNRRVTGVNVYQQSRLRNSGFKIGSDRYKNLLRKVCAEWRSMSTEERHPFELRAAEQTAARLGVAQRTLAEREILENTADAPDELARKLQPGL